MSSQNDEITAFLARWIAAERDADKASVDRYLTDDFVGVGPLGFILTRPEWMARHETGDLVYETLALEDVQVRTYGTTAVVVALQTGIGAYRGFPVPETTRATVVVVQGPDGGWQVANVQYSFVAGTPGAPPIPGPPPRQQDPS
ncbi:MAG TPA: nuclear transport factor 2 family protein [Acidimicrobiales bacterium]|nr:nuclear transport factor 2 family protein [Acidimicrobiales bacterium]